MVRLPGQVLVGHVVDGRTGKRGIRRAGVIQRLIGIVGTHAVVALHAVGEFQRQVVQPRDVAHERLLRHAPRSSHGPEVAPAGAAGEARRTVGAPASGEVVLVVVAVTDAREDRFDAVFVRRTARADDDGRRIQFVDAAAGKPGLVAGEVRGRIGVVLVSEKQVDIVPVERAVIGEQLVERIAERRGVRFLDTSADRLGVPEEGVIIGHGLRVVVVGAEVELEFQPLAPVVHEIHMRASRKRIGGQRIFVVVERGDAVEVGLLARRTRRSVVELLLAVRVAQIVARLGIALVDRIDRGHHLRRKEHVGGSARRGLGRVGRIAGEVRAHARREPGLRLRFDVQTTRIAFEVGRFKHAVLVQVTQRKHILGLLVAARNAGAVFLPERGVVGHLIEPVLVPQQFRIVAHLAVGGEELRQGNVVGIVHLIAAENAFRARCHLRDGIAAVVVVEGRIHDLHEIPGPDRFVAGNGPRRDAHVDFQLHVRLVAIAFLRVDEHDAVGAASTVEHRRRSVFQDADAGDVVGVDGRDGSVVGNAVHDVERRR